ncbi:MAG: hypothetical protein II751_03680, partial [Bacteroidales bacterium]|nr:hypothetical protein [Bacteroidales bacterium]
GASVGAAMRGCPDFYPKKAITNVTFPEYPYFMGRKFNEKRNWKWQTESRNTTPSSKGNDKIFLLC